MSNLTSHGQPAAKPTGMGGLLRAAATKFPDREFVFPNDRCSFRQLDARADAWAETITRAGVAEGDNVGLWIPASIDMIAAIFGCVRAGAVAVPVNDRFRVDELGYVIEHGDLTALFTVRSNEFSDRPSELIQALPTLASQTSQLLELPEAPRLRRVIILGEAHAAPMWTSTSELGLPAKGAAITEGTQQTFRDHSIGDQVAYLMYTSGTSASPKACMISHAGVLSQADSMAIHRWKLDPECAFWCPVPLFHTAGLSAMAACLVGGANFVHAGQFEPGISLRMMEQEQVTHGNPCFETIWLRILDHPRFHETDLSRLRTVLNTGGEDLLRKLQARIPHVSQVANYGITEGSGHVAMTQIDDPLDVRVSTGGHPMPGMETRIVDPATRDVQPAGTEGEIQFRGVARFLGYYKDDETNARVLDADGWFHSGDLGVMDTAGRLTFRGRLKDMLKVGGENVASLEVESYLLRHPAVNVAAVVAAPDSYYGEVPTAYVELAPGATVTEQELIDFCVDRIATYKVPRYVRFVESWPMSGTKIRKFKLREQIANELSASGITQAPRIHSTRSQSQQPN